MRRDVRLMWTRLETTVQEYAIAMTSLVKTIESTVVRVGLLGQTVSQTAHVPAQQTTGAVSEAGNMNMGTGGHTGHSGYPAGNMGCMPTMPNMPNMTMPVMFDGMGPTWSGGRVVSGSGVDNQEGPYTPQ